MKIQTLVALTALFVAGLALGGCRSSGNSQAASATTSAAQASATATTQNAVYAQTEQELTAEGFKVVPGSASSAGSGATYILLDLGCGHVPFFLDYGSGGKLGVETQTTTVSPDGDAATYRTYHFIAQPTPEQIQTDKLCNS